MRSWLEEKGWLQGKFVKLSDVKILKCFFIDIPQDEEVYLIVASQSCDVCAFVDKEPFIEFSIARKIDKIDGSFSFNKHPRKLHLEVFDDSKSTSDIIVLELIAHEKIKLNKEEIKDKLEEIEPCQCIQLSQKSKEQYIDWLASRYKRPALPTEFERRFNEQWSRSKRDKSVEKVNEFLLGIYVDIIPDEEIEINSKYQVQLLFLIVADISDDNKILVEQLSKQYQTCLEEANMTVISNNIKTEKQVSVATFRNYKRFYLDYLSYKHNTEVSI